MAAGVDTLKENIKEVLNTEGGGTPSEPGEPPHRQTGNLMDSVKGHTVGKSGKVSIEADYAYDLEFGNGETPARPFARNEIFKLESELHKKYRKVR